MNRRRFLPVLAAPLLRRGASAAQRNDLPNIVIILADDLGYGDLSSYGGSVPTPNIDRLAREGMRFTDAHSPHPVCTPTRYGLMTGRYSWRTWAGTANVWSDDPLLIDTNRLTLPGLLKKAGYKTGAIGKWHLGFGAPGAKSWDKDDGIDYNGEIKPGPLEVGFDYFFGIPHVGQFPHIFIENHRVVGLRKDSPLKIVRDERWRKRTSYLERVGDPPRHTFTGGEGALYKHEDLALELTKRAKGWLEANAGERFFLYFAHRNVHGPIIPNPRFAGKSGIGRYGDFLLELDWSVGEILQTLDRLGKAENTLVLFSSDNGAVQAGPRPAHGRVEYQGHFANGPLRGQKTEAYEGGHRVPLLARWPGRIQPGSISRDLCALTDTIATAAELTGQKLPSNAGEDSYSYLPFLLVSKPAGPVRTSLVHNGYRGGFAIRKGPWKLLTFQGGGGLGWNKDDHDPSQPPGQLYNLDVDLAESKNLYNERPEIVSELSSSLAKIRDSGRSRV